MSKNNGLLGVGNGLHRLVPELLLVAGFTMPQLALRHALLLPLCPSNSAPAGPRGASRNEPCQGHFSPSQQGCRVDDADLELLSSLGWIEFPSRRPASLGWMELPSRQPSRRCCARRAGKSLPRPSLLLSDCDVCAEHDKWLCNDEELVNVVLCVAMEWRGLVLASSCP